MTEPGEKSLNPSRCCSSHTMCSSTQLKCSKPGPVTNNGYLNFLRDFRKTHCGLMPREMITKAARSWKRLCEGKKDHYRRMAGKVSAQRKKRTVCPKCKRDLKVPSSEIVNNNSEKGRKKGSSHSLKGNVSKSRF